MRVPDRGVGGFEILDEGQVVGAQDLGLVVADPLVEAPDNAIAVLASPKRLLSIDEHRVTFAPRGKASCCGKGRNRGIVLIDIHRSIRKRPVLRGGRSLHHHVHEWPIGGCQVCVALTTNTIRQCTLFMTRQL